MKIYERFTTELDGSGEKISEGLSEVDLSNPEDVKALIPDKSNEILVHFGDVDFLERYRRFQEHLPEWRTVYPKLSSVDMRYERQVVLEMQSGAGVPVANSGDGASAPAADSKTAATATSNAVDDALKASAKAAPAVHSPVAKHAAVVKGKPAAAHPTAQSKATAAEAKKKKDAKAKAAATAKHHTVTAQGPATTTQYHPTQAAHP
jgi:cell division protein FtsQ